uniref:Biogenesis of lysosome-related organelles complex 1 subunit CNL1 n=1 Tax=Lygus hesperus TaxID=30085 RepID=A0A0A9XF43_LYGHE
MILADSGCLKLLVVNQGFPEAHVNLLRRQYNWCNPHQDRVHYHQQPQPFCPAVRYFNPSAPNVTKEDRAQYLKYMRRRWCRRHNADRDIMHGGTPRGIRQDRPAGGVRRKLQDYFDRPDVYNDYLRNRQRTSCQVANTARVVPACHSKSYRPRI